MIPPTAPPAGRTQIASRALEHLAKRCAAEEFAVAPKELDVQVSDEDGRLRLRVEGPVTLPPRGVDGAATETLLELAQRRRHAILTRYAALSGREVARVELVLTGARFAQPTRSLR